MIRLKHLPDEADSTDIRKFFKKIDIPDGGVRILGGEKGVVYITVDSEEGKSHFLYLEKRSCFLDNGLFEKIGKRGILLADILTKSYLSC